MLSFFFSERSDKRELKAEKCLQYLIYELRYRSLNLDKFVEQELLFYSLREIIKLKLSVFLLNFPYYLSCI